MPEPLPFRFQIPHSGKVHLLPRLYFLSQALVHSLKKIVDKLIFLPSAAHTGKSQETAQFAVWEGMSSKERGGHRLAIGAEETCYGLRNRGVPRGDEKWCCGV